MRHFASTRATAGRWSILEGGGVPGSGGCLDWRAVAQEPTFVLVKPDGMQRDLVGEVIACAAGRLVIDFLDDPDLQALRQRLTGPQL